MCIPQYKTVSGICFPEAEIVKGHKQTCILNTTVDECVEYTKVLEINGYTQYDAKEFSAGTDKNYNKNLFYTYVKNSIQIFIYWAASCRAVYIVKTNNTVLPSTEKFTTKNTGKTPTVTQCRLDRGYVYIIQLPDESFVLIDGDQKNEGDTKALYDYLTKNISDGEEVSIAMWMFTHPDVDHIKLATNFVKEYSAKVEISAFAYQFTDCDKMQYLFIDSSKIKNDIEKLENNIKLYYPDSAVYTLHTGQKYYFPGIEIEVLLTADLLYPYFYTSANDTSAALRVNFKNGKKAIFLGDCMQDSCRKLAYIYGDYLKSDILQITHHGLIGGEIGLYKLIDPEICLWSISEERFTGTLNGQKYQWCIGEGGCDYNKWIRDDSIRKRKHYHLGETAIINCI